MSEFYLRVAGADPKSWVDIELECETPTEALRVALAVDSPHGHALWGGRRLLGRFEPSWNALLHAANGDDPDAEEGDES